MEPFQDLAIVLRSTSYSERHKIVAAITEHHGKISAIALNAISSRRFGGGLNFCTAGVWSVGAKKNAELFRLDEVQVKKSFSDLAKDFEKLSAASFLAELLLRIAPEGEPANDLFKLHSNALAALEELSGSDRVIVIVNAYLTKILLWSGMHPNWEACSGCGVSLEGLEPAEKVLPVAESGGWLCPHCIRSSKDTSLERVTALSLWDALVSFRFPMRKVSDEIRASVPEHEALFIALESFLLYHVPGFDRTALKSRAFIGLRSGLPPQEDYSPHELPPSQKKL